MPKRGLLGIAGLLLVAAALPLSASARSAGGSTITVNTLADTMSVDGLCTLREAIGNANANTAQNTDCAAGKGDDKIVFSVGGTIPLGSELPAVQDLLTIDGGHMITLDGDSSNRIFTFTAKRATLMNMTLTHGSSDDGGAIQSLGGKLVLDTVTLSNNGASDAGGAIFNGMGALEVRNSVFDSNEAGGGGAILSLESVVVQNSTFVNNLAEEGGAILSEGQVRMSSSLVAGNEGFLVGAIFALISATITDTEVTENVGNFPTVLVGPVFGPGSKLSKLLPTPHGPLPAGAKWLMRGSIAKGQPGGAVFQRDYIHDNEASCFGGGVAVIFVKLAILDSTISDNTTTSFECGEGIGGGVVAEAQNAVIANTTIANNTAEGDAGGIAYFGLTPLSLTNSTITGNSVSDASGAGGIGLAGGQVVLTNTIVAGNYGGGDDTDCGLVPLGPGDPFVSGGHNIDGDGTCNLDQPSDMPNTDPQLLPLNNWGGPIPTMPPADGSPAVDTGDTQTCKAKPVSKHDERGVARPQGPACDIGAVERTGDEEL
jgi:CSLREA domain-containing protein